jgi:hypothetical protein
MSTKIAKKSFVHESGGTRTEVIEGSLFSSDHPAVQARPKDFAKASEADVAEAVAKARGE